MTRSASVKGVLLDGLVTVVGVKWLGSAIIELVYKDAGGRLVNELLYRDREPTLEIVTAGQQWSFDSDGRLLRFISEAKRIRLAHLFGPPLTVHALFVEPLISTDTAFDDCPVRRLG